jgi:uncharacterized protein (TIGR03086 family)
VDLLALYDNATSWTAARVAGAADHLDAPTPCTEWDVRRLIDHLLAGQAMFAAGPTGGPIAPPAGPPPALVGADPAAQYEMARSATLHAYAQPGVLETTMKGFTGDMPAMEVLGIAFCDQLVHGWDLARATGQDTAMPNGLADVAWMMLDGRIPEAARGPGQNFGPIVAVPADATAQAKLLGYCGRTADQQGDRP